MKDFELSSVHLRRQVRVGYGMRKASSAAQFGYKIARPQAHRHQSGLRPTDLGDRLDKPESAPLPVLLAVSLLKNSCGEIDLDPPSAVRWTIRSSASAASSEGDCQSDRQAITSPVRAAGLDLRRQRRGAWRGWISMPALFAPAGMALKPSSGRDRQGHE